MGRVLRAGPGLRTRLVIASKSGIAPPAPYHSHRTYLIVAREAWLRRPRIAPVDLSQMRLPDLRTRPVELAAALDALRSSGKMRTAGVSNYIASQTCAARAHPPFPLATT